MNRLDPCYRAETTPGCDPAACVTGKAYRFTVLTPYLIRMEYAEDGRFEDRPSQTVFNRRFPAPKFDVAETDDSLEIITGPLHLRYDKRPFSPAGLSVKVEAATAGNANVATVWHYGDGPGKKNLGGTTRTLDEADGAIPLEPGLMSTLGYSVLDDSASLLLEADGWVCPRVPGVKDLYFFGYGRNYRACLKDFYALTGPAPLLPRFALGNWWSRYHRYTDTEYKALMERFEAEGIPFSVAVIDMDWHLVDDVDPRYGTGWTGYTWNRKLFPDPPAFLAWLHGKGLKVTLNLHPADGVRPHEEAYPAMAAAMGVDPETGRAIDFDIASPAFLQNYFRHLHHPMEEQGVDFWWIDWQQGTGSAMQGLDPLWMLNHYHFLDSGRRGRRRLTFSRYAGPGSHRTPVGFSGDAVISWESLDFQPYFTATASNIGYGWWSHDIGGHMFGIRDDALATRWVQFGVFSPILRLHSTQSPFNSKEPWLFSPAARQSMTEFLRLRHALVPYLYAMNRRASREGAPLVQPMYYSHPQAPEAYTVPNQYWFGSELIACPITTPDDDALMLGAFRAWLPQGQWTDFFTGHNYTGGRRQALWRPLGGMPVLARAGAIVPLAGAIAEGWLDCAAGKQPEPDALRTAPRRVSNSPEGAAAGGEGEAGNTTANPEALKIMVFPGTDGQFRLWEDEGDTLEDRDENWCCTPLAMDWAAGTFTAGPAEGNTAVIPASRRWAVCFRGFAQTTAQVTVGGKPAQAQTAYDAETRTLTVALAAAVPAGQAVAIKLAGAATAQNDGPARAFAILNAMQCPFPLKERMWQAIQGAMPAAPAGPDGPQSTAAPAGALAALAAIEGVTANMLSALAEALAAQG